MIHFGAIEIQIMFTQGNRRVKYGAQQKSTIINHHLFIFFSEN